MAALGPTNVLSINNQEVLIKGASDKKILISIKTIFSCFKHLEINIMNILVQQNQF